MMDIGDFRVRPPAKHVDLVQNLINESGFQTIADVLVFSASLGFGKTRRSPIEKGGEGIRISVFRNIDHALDLFAMLAVAGSREFNSNLVLPSQIEKQIEIFQEYATGGLDFIQEQVSAYEYKNLGEIIEELIRKEISERPDQDNFTDEELEGLMML